MFVSVYGLSISNFAILEITKIDNVSIKYTHCLKVSIKKDV